MENTGFKKGQIVYVSNDGENWMLSHFSGFSHDTDRPTVNMGYVDAIRGLKDFEYNKCLSVEDYHKMLNQPKDKDLVWVWHDNALFGREARFYDAKNKKCFCVTHNCRDGAEYKKYEIIPRDQWPQWAIEAYELLED